MITNADITIYNQKSNPVTKLTEYVRTQIRNVHWYTDQKTSVDQSGVHSADIYKIRIPEESVTDREFLDHSEWKQSEDTDGYWTIQNDDLVVRGLVDDDIRQASDLLNKYPYVARVNSFSDNRRGNNPHFRIGGVS